MQKTLFEEKNKQYLDFYFNAKREYKICLLYGLCLFIFPFLLSNQLLLGTIINALLIKSAMSLKTKKVFLLSMIPSCAAFSAGILFSNLTHQLILMLPFIWAGNFVLMIIIKKIHAKGKKEFFYSNLIAGTAKTTLLFVPAATLFSLSISPAIALATFGIMQFATSQLGGALAAITNAVRIKTTKKN